MKHRATPHRLPRSVAVILAVAGLAAGAITTAEQSQAAGLNLLTTVTTVTSSADHSADKINVGDSVTFTVTVALQGLNVGLGVSPTGTVAFTNSTDAGATALGSVALGSCFLKTCTATFTSSAFTRGNNAVTATYSGDLVAKSSNAVSFLSATQTATAATPYSKTCSAGVSCTTGDVSSTDDVTTVDVTANPSAGPNTVTAYLDPTPLPCVTPNAGITAVFSETAPDATKDVRYYVDGPEGGAGDIGFFGTPAAAAAWHADHSTPVRPAHVCYASATQFNGYAPSAGAGGWTNTSSDYTYFGPVAFDSGAGAYVGLLPNCSAVSNVAPCVVSEYLQINDDDELQIHIITPPGDPRITN